MEQQKYYFIYQTTNKINGKIYIGKHETNDLNDGYLGSGKLLWKAIEKYGIENFERTILFFCESRNELNAKEAEIVNEEFVLRKDTYNLKVGGDGGWSLVNSTLQKQEIADRGRNAMIRIKADPLKFQEFRSKISDVLKIKFKNGLVNGFKGKHHRKETLEKIRETKRKNPQCGKKNSVYGTHWWKNPEGTEAKMIKEGDPVPEGWVRGKVVSEAEKYGNPIYRQRSGK